MKLFKFLFLISFLFSCQSENNKDYPSQEKEIKTDSNSIENISKIDSNEDSSESFNENSMEIDSNYAALFNDNEWLALKSDENLINNSARCSKCWHDHDYSPFKVKDTIQTIFFDKKTKDTSATLITISSARLSNISDVLNNKSETIFNKEIKVYKKGIIIGEWLQVGISVDEIIEHLGKPDFNNNKVMYYQKADNHIWFVDFLLENNKVVNFRIGHYST